MLIEPLSVPLSAAAAPAGGTIMFLERALLLLPLLLLAGFFSGTETALFSLSAAQREAFSQQGDSVAGRVLWLLSNPRRLITTLILGNEVVNVTLSSFITALVAGAMSKVSQLSEPSGSITAHLPAVPREGLVAVVATLVTVPVLIVFGELIPKTIAIKLAPRWARMTASIMALVTWLLWLPRMAVSAVAGTVLFFVGGGKRNRALEIQPVLREREFRTLVDMGSAEGEIEGTERRMIHNVFEFGDLTVGSVMTPAARVFALPVEMPLSRLVEAVSSQRYSRVPVYRGRKDNVVGILFAKDLVGYAQGDMEGRPLVDLLHPPLFVPRRAKCDRLLREFQRRRTHLALVVDEYGKLSGLVTMEDLLQSLFGDIADPVTPASPASPRRAASEPVTMEAGAAEGIGAALGDPSAGTKKSGEEP